MLHLAAHFHKVQVRKKQEDRWHGSGDAKVARPTSSQDRPHMFKTGAKLIGGEMEHMSASWPENEITLKCHATATMFSTKYANL